jgi:hypothetical protein
VAAVRAELAALTALWSSRRGSLGGWDGQGGAFVAVPAQLLPGDVARFVVKLPPMPTPPWGGSGVFHGNYASLCLVLGLRSLHSTQDDRAGGGPMAGMMSMLSMSAEPPFLRGDLLSPQR